MKKTYLLLSFCISFLLIGCQEEAQHHEIPRPYEPYVFRSVLDTMPRMITMALHNDLWTAHNTQSGAMYKTWKGTIKFDGPVYNQKHGPQPTSMGGAYFINKHESPWQIFSNGKQIDVQYNYRGHRFENGSVLLQHELAFDKRVISVSEKVEIIENDNNQLGLERVFFVDEEIPNDIEIRLKINVDNIIVEQNIQTNGKWDIENREIREIDSKEILAIDGSLTLRRDEPTNFVCFLTDFGLIPNPNDPEKEYDAQDENLPLGARLMAQNDCRTCHNSKLKTVGPSYISVANMYQSTEENTEYLANKIIEGGSGRWGDQAMTPHPKLDPNHAKEMVRYILSLRTEEVEEKQKSQIISLAADTTVQEENLIPGLMTSIYNLPTNIQKLPDFDKMGEPIMGGILPNLDNLAGSDFIDLTEHFGLLSEGYIFIEKEQSYDFRMWSDDGSKLWIDDQLIVDHDGLHGLSMKESKVYLKEGYHKVRIEFMNGCCELFLSFNWKPEDEKIWKVVPPFVLSHTGEQQYAITKKGLTLPMSVVTKIPGDERKLEDVHPSFDLYQARPIDFTPMVGGMDFLEDGRLIVSVWEPSGGVYILDNVDSGNEENITIKKIASGLAEPLGVKVVNDQIYVMQKQEITQLIDHDGDELIDEYRTLCDDWTVSANFHEFGFGLEEKDGYLYAALATAIEPGGASTQPQQKDRGKVLKVSIADGNAEFIAVGLRTPNGVGVGYEGELFVSDNEGDWLPSSKINHIKENAWFGSRSVEDYGQNTDKYPDWDRPVVWLPQGEIGNSPSTPSYLDKGPYQGQMIHGEVTHGGVKRVFVEEVNGRLQGSVFRFVQGLEAGVNRLTWGPDGALYIGGIGNPGNWGQNNKKWYGLQRLEYNGTSVFEMLAVRARSNGVEIEFTEALQEGDGWSTEDFVVKQWKYVPTAQYGGPKLDEKKLEILSANVSEDRKKVFLELKNMQEDHVVYVRLKNKFVSDQMNSLWTTEAWYTMNQIPQDNPGFTSEAPEPTAVNSLSSLEKEKGWELLFDGKNMEKWRNFKSENVNNAWVIDGDAFHLDLSQENVQGGDIITKDQYENFELKLEWKIQNCGNSGIMFNVVEDEKYCCVWQTGPEMQILDNSCHPDTKWPTHRAGDLYDLLECKYVTVKPAGEWNQAHIISNQGKVDFWLNGYKVVEFTMFDDNWTEMIANSKFKDMPDFGLAHSGHISLQDHGDKVWFRNVKVRRI